MELDMELVSWSCRTLLAVVFAIAVAGKLRGAGSFGAFVRSTRELAALSARRGLAVARLVIGAEAVGVVLLLCPGRAAVAGFALAGCLLAAFTVATGASLRRGVRVPCRCFGSSAGDAGVLHLVRNGFLIAVAVVGAAGTPPGLPDTAGGLAVAVATGLVLGVVVTVLDDISESLRDSFVVTVRKGQS
ncbi:MauE/DoxX family redox-associated membrane protein [Streptomyces sp. NPDC014734]|uniref:MauE/DoxX family redox-associated membrane protein n=1 Tax=Streptomyces sp. NPDC014734 TaxID=3364886 RepID=UPI0036FCD59E